jgi:DNA-binding NtrC family response regulator
MHDHFALQRLVGESHWTERTRSRILQVSRYSYPVLISGPAGTGKQLVARAIHAHSPRSSQPLIPFHCGRLPAAQAQLQLFGHAAGASKLARHAALGCLGAAQGGTLLLHEVGDLDLDTQDRLLQVLMEKRSRPVGATRDRAADVRIIATTSRDLREAAEAGSFRLPLLYSLCAIRVKALPLSQRRADIAPLARHIVARVTLENGLPYRPLTPDALALLEAYLWPGNVSEMEQVLEQAVLASGGGALELVDFAELFASVQRQVESAGCGESGVREGGEAGEREPESVNNYEAIPRLPVVAESWPSLLQLEAEHLRATLRRAGQNLAVAARLLDLELPELQAKLAKHRLQLPPQPTPLSDRLA